MKKRVLVFIFFALTLGLVSAPKALGRCSVSRVVFGFYGGVMNLDVDAECNSKATALVKRRAIERWVLVNTKTQEVILSDNTGQQQAVGKFNLVNKVAVVYDWNNNQLQEVSQIPPKVLDFYAKFNDVTAVGQPDCGWAMTYFDPQVLDKENILIDWGEDTILVKGSEQSISFVQDPLGECYNYSLVSLESLSRTKVLIVRNFYENGRTRVQMVRIE